MTFWPWSFSSVSRASLLLHFSWQHYHYMFEEGKATLLSLKAFLFWALKPDLHELGLCEFRMANISDCSSRVISLEVADRQTDRQTYRRSATHNKYDLKQHLYCNTWLTVPWSHAQQLNDTEWEFWDPLDNTARTTLRDREINTAE